ncbi:MAG: tagaturonate reductase, partial [Mycoplasmataceae bacterium]|nr:tagaturonate reductase [Mycoplasmataceae bacterium]
ALLYKRFKHFDGSSDKGLTFFPCELIENNGKELQEIILKLSSDWELGDDFTSWINENNTFCNTLVDRIVPGYPRNKIEAITEELGYKDNLVVEGEQFHLWVIEGPKSLEEIFPASQSGLNVIFTDNLEQYRTRKVRILNGAHTSLVPVGLLSGIANVRESIEDEVVGSFLRKAISDEICKTLDLSDEELTQFSDDVMERFLNPYLDHALMSISLNSISKFKTRVLPSLTEYVRREDTLPKYLTMSLSALIIFYKGEINGEKIDLKDDKEVIDFFNTLWNNNSNKKNNSLESMELISKSVLSRIDFWGEDLTQINGLEHLVSSNLYKIVNNGITKALKQL